EGSFDLVVYDLDGNVAASRTINIDYATVMTGESGSNSIEAQISKSNDDNSNNSANDDIDDFFEHGFNFSHSEDGSLRLELSIDAISQSEGYSFSIKDNLPDEKFSSGTNFAGALGMSRLFDGDSADNIRLSSDLATRPTLLSASATAVDGDNSLALAMMQHQFESFDVHVGDKETFNTTAYGMFDIVATSVGTAANAAITNNETISTQFNAIELEFFSTSKVSVDEEMTNLIKYQASYSAAAKIITTVDQMMQTLLGIKQ
ncbi:MAG: flagellar basal body rod C-terminal domain-containing protein, partial [Campylobacterota bacterium]|nr:flagellar basal body rod C-terminal domain-containing protein [Campylobacterota bacterium]